jgi:pimeloyl-ACP methyl ester carboxylesterase
MRACFLIALLGFAAAPLLAGEPIVIAEQGNFQVGGREVETKAGKIVADSMYVEFQIPAKRLHAEPIVFLHGGASTGATFWSTPDGREGWATLFVRKGYAVYVVDRPTLGRSPHYETVDGPKLTPPVAMPAPPPGGELAPTPPRPTRLPGIGKPGDPAYEQGIRSRQSTIEVPFGSPRDPLEVSTYVDTIDRAAGAALLDKIGPAILVTHSRAGTTGWQIADARPNLVKAIIAIEPNGPPFRNAPPFGQPSDPIARPFGLTYAPIAFDPPVKSAADFGTLRREAPKGRNRIGCWVPSGPPRRLVNLARVPVMLVTGGSSYHAAYDHCTADFLTRSGVSGSQVLLDDIGITGNTHGLPTETNNGEIADLIARWLADRKL